jgi:hypothetical protein
MQEHQDALHKALKADLAAIAETVNQTTASANTLLSTVETISQKIGLLASLRSPFGLASVMVVLVGVYMMNHTPVMRRIVSVRTSPSSSI